MGGVRFIGGGAGGGKKLRSELGKGEMCIRCSQTHSSGSGVRPDVIPVARDTQYVIHGTSLDAAPCIARECLQQGDRLRAQFYECGDNGHVLGGRAVRGGSEVSIVVSERQCNDDGIVFYRPPNDVTMTEGANGAIGPKTSRYILRVRRPHR